MTTIFISGSRNIPYLPEEVKTRLDKIIESGFDIIVGDSERGVDSTVLKYLKSQLYENVTVYTVRDKPRAKSMLDAWGIQKIDPGEEAKTDKAGNVRNQRELETAKDFAMGQDADFGLVVWQSTYTNRFGRTSVSKGSLRNMHQLLSDGKPVVLYKTDEADDGTPQFACHQLKTISDLSELISSEPNIVAKAYAEIEKKAARDTPTLF